MPPQRRVLGLQILQHIALNDHDEPPASALIGAMWWPISLLPVKCFADMVIIFSQFVGLIFLTRDKNFRAPELNLSNLVS